MAELYIPNFETQTDQNAPSPWTNCTPAAGAMLVDWHSYGRQRTNDIELRAASGVHPSLGMNYAALRPAIKKVEGLDMLFSEWDRSGNKNLTWAGLREHLADLGGSAVAGQYKALRGWTNEKGQAVDRFQPGGDFGHNVFVCDYRPTALGGDGRVLWMDPLGRGTYRGDRIPLEALWAFIFKSGNTADAFVAAAHGFTQARPAGPMPKGPMGSIQFRDPVVTQEWTTIKGAPFTRANGTTGEFTQEVRVTSIAELIVGGKDCRLLDFGPDHEQLIIFRTGLKDPGARIVGSATGATEKQLAAARNAGYLIGKEDGFEDGRKQGRSEGIQAAREDLEDLT